MAAPALEAAEDVIAKLVPTLEEGRVIVPQAHGLTLDRLCPSGDETTPMFARKLHIYSA